MITTLQNTPVTIDLLTLGNSRGWSIDGTDAVHEICNSGKIKLRDYPIVAGVTYEFTYQIKSIDSGYVQPELGGVLGTLKNTVGFETVIITAINTNPVAFYSNANCRISIFNIRNTQNTINSESRDTVTWSEMINRWVSYRSYVPDCGYSLFANLFTYKNGQLWVHSLDAQRNSFYGTTYASRIKFTANANQIEVKTFESVSYESNRLLITTANGVSTSLGQISELTDVDFLQETLNDGVSTVNVYDVEGVLSASFMRDKNEDIVNGSVLKGSYITIELTTVDEGVLRLKNVLVNSVKSFIGSR